MRCGGCSRARYDRLGGARGERQYEAQSPKCGHKFGCVPTRTTRSCRSPPSLAGEAAAGSRELAGLDDRSRVGSNRRSQTSLIAGCRARKAAARERLRFQNQPGLPDPVISPWVPEIRPTRPSPSRGPRGVGDAARFETLEPSIHKCGHVLRGLAEVSDLRLRRHLSGHRGLLSKSGLVLLEQLQRQDDLARLPVDDVALPCQKYGSLLRIG